MRNDLPAHDKFRSCEQEENLPMLVRSQARLIGCATLLFAGTLLAQPSSVPTTPTPIPKADPPPGRNVIAARVNGQPILELAVYRGLKDVPIVRREDMRKEVLHFLIDNTIVDQYLVQLKLQVEPKEIEEHITKMKEECKKVGEDFDKLLVKLMITETEMRTELQSALRWDKFVLQQGTPEKLRDLFDKNVEMFNGSRMHARHILVAAQDGKKDVAYARIMSIKKSINDEVTQAVAKLPATMPPLDREKERAKVLDKTFAEIAMSQSSCPSKKDGGNLGLFPRVGAMVEPVARAAFALKPYQMSEPVPTEFGYHLILAVDFKPGKEVKYDDVRPIVQEVYAGRLREAILAHYKSKSKIEILEVKK